MQNFPLCHIIPYAHSENQLDFLQFACRKRHTKHIGHDIISGMKKIRRVAVAVERSSAYGRSFIRGVSEIAELHPEWALTLLDPHSITDNISAGYDGWICRIADAHAATALRKCGRPVVDCLCAKPYPCFATVRTDADAIGRLAAEHLLKRHFANFAFCGYRRVSFSDRRRNAFAGHLKGKGFATAIYRPPLRPANRFGRDFLLGDRVELPPDIEDLAVWLKRLPKPVGIFCCDDLRASQVMGVCRSLKIDVPSQVALLGVDNDPIYCMFSTPRLSSIDPDATAIGCVAATTLDKMFTDTSISREPPTLTVPPKGIVERASTNTYPDAPSWFGEALIFIHDNVARQISASDVFQHVGRSRTLVERTFRNILDTTVQKMIAAERIAEAKRLLTSTVLPIKEIASLSGFSTLEYLSRTFTATTGLSPTSWRENEQPANQP